MSDLNTTGDDLVKQNSDNIDTVYPKLDIKIIGGAKASGKMSLNSSFSNSEAVLEEEDVESNIPEVKLIDCIKENMLKKMNDTAITKHVNLLTDSDEFNYHQGGVKQQESSIRQRSQSNEMGNSQHLIEDSIQEGGREEEEDKVAVVSKLGASTHLIEDSIMLDKGEFDCSTPTKKMTKSQSKKVTQSGQYSQFSNQQRDVIAEDETEGDGAQQVFFGRISSSHREIKIKVDEIDTEKSQKSFTPYQNYMETSMPIMEEQKEDEVCEMNQQLSAAKQERENQIEFFKKIARGDRITGSEILKDLEAQGIQGSLAVSESQCINEDNEYDGTNDEQEDEGIKKPNNKEKSTVPQEDEEQ